MKRYGIIPVTDEKGVTHMKVNAKQVNELRKMTNAGIMDCKNALQENNGNIEASIDWLKKNGIIQSTVRSGNMTAEGICRIRINGSKAVIVEINCQSDFAAKTPQFIQLADSAAELILAFEAETVEEALALKAGGGTLKDMIAETAAVLGENVTLRRFEVLRKNEDEIFGDYTHQGGRICALCILNGNADGAIAHNLAMQVTSMNPKYISRSEMPAEIIEKEREIQQALVAKDEKLAGKPEKVRAGIVNGRVSKALKDMCLVDQDFFLDSNMKCGDYLKNCGASVLKFVRYAAGEGIGEKQ